MYSISRFFKTAYSSFASVDFDFLIWTDLAAFALLFVIVLIATLSSKKVRYMDKKPFFHLVNLFTAITAAVLLCEFEVRQSLLFTCIFWFVGYIMYGILCALSKKRPNNESRPITLSTLNIQPPTQRVAPPVPAAQNAVRLEHALSITEKLLQKSLAKGDRQELEKMKTTLTILSSKDITPQEGEMLNETFNTLLKLMAKYNL